MVQNRGTLSSVFTHLLRRSPCIVVLEDLDTFTNETQLTRAGLLAQLDGIGRSDGVLVLGTTNHPEHVDSALLHRPSRFDRVWRFSLPDRELRHQYLVQAFPGADSQQID